MTLSDKEFAAQQEQLKTLEEELSRLDAQYEAQIKALGFSEKEIQESLNAELPPELQNMITEAQDRAKREGSARAAQAAPTPTTGGKVPGAGRRGAVRL